MSYQSVSFDVEDSHSKYGSMSMSKYGYQTSLIDQKHNKNKSFGTGSRSDKIAPYPRPELSLAVSEAKYEAVKILVFSSTSSHIIQISNVILAIPIVIDSVERILAKDKIVGGHLKKQVALRIIYDLIERTTSITREEKNALHAACSLSVPPAIDAMVDVGNKARKSSIFSCCFKQKKNK